MRQNLLLLVFPLLWLSCTRQPAALTQIQQQRTGDYVVILLSSTGTLKQRSNSLALEFHNPTTNELVTVSNVRIQATMRMPGTGPMLANLSSPQQTTPGRYTFDADFSMAGQWAFLVTFDPNGRVQFNLSAQ